MDKDELELRKFCLEVSSHSLVIDEKTLPGILENAQKIYEWLKK